MNKWTDGRTRQEHTASACQPVLVENKNFQKLWKLTRDVRKTEIRFKFGF